MWADVEALGLKYSLRNEVLIRCDFIQRNLAFRPASKWLVSISDRGTSILAALGALNYDWC